jgi:hypothetical protein
MIARLVPFVLLASLPALADGTPTATATVPAPAAEPQAPAFPLHASASLTNSAGTGTFILPGTGTYSDTQITSLLVLSGSAKINESWSASAMMRLATEWTQPDDATYQGQINLFDPRFAVSYKALSIKDIGLDLGVSGGYWLPISMPSRAAGSLGTFTLGGKVGYVPPQVAGLSTYGALGIGWGPTIPGLWSNISKGHDFVATNGQATETLSCAQGVRSGDVNNGACGGVGRAYRWNAGLGAAYSFLDDQLSASADVTYIQSFNTFQPFSNSDQLGYTNLNAAPAKGAFDLYEGVATVGSAGLSYTPVKWFTLTGGIYTYQPITSDGRNIRWFPFWDLGTFTAGGANNNFSSVFIDTTFSI